MANLAVGDRGTAVRIPDGDFSGNQRKEQIQASIGDR
jgi:hypothetical protein